MCGWLGRKKSWKIGANYYKQVVTDNFGNFSEWMILIKSSKKNDIDSDNTILTNNVDY